MSTDITRIPQELRDTRQWVCWKSEQRGNGKPTKIPYAVKGYKASTTKPDDWSSFSEVIEFECDYSGIGFVFTKQDPYVGLDLDDCFVDGEVQAWAKPIIESLSGTYSEVSPSGNGLKFFMRGKLPFDKGKNVKIENGGIEIYDHSRYFAVTGESFGSSVIAEQQEFINWVCATYFKPKEVSSPVVEVSAFSSDWNSIPLETRIERASKYLAKADPATQGNNASGITYRLACTLARGFALPEQEVFNLLRNEYNPRCIGADGSQSPWTDQELMRKASEGAKASDPIGNMLQPKPTALSYGAEVNGICMPPAMNQVITPIQGNVEAPELEVAYDDTEGMLTEEEFFASMVPESGLMRDMFDYYFRTSRRRTSSMGLCVAVSVMQTILGRRIASHTGLRTNDYNIVIAGTSSGKESCDKTTQRLISSGIDNAMLVDRDHIVPPDITSGNSVMRVVAEQKATIWICDEFGEVLGNMLDKSSNNAHTRQITTMLLKLYGKSDAMYRGTAYASETRNAVNQPHLCMLGMTTYRMFDSISADEIENGLYGRLAFWPSSRTTPVKSSLPEDVPVGIAENIGKWLRFSHGNLSWENPDPPRIPMTPDALKRWEDHEEQISIKSNDEQELKAGVWGRVAARSMKLALCHRCARLEGDPSETGFDFQIELEDVEWGIKLSNQLARISFALVEESVVDTHLDAAKKFVLKKLKEKAGLKWATPRLIYRGSKFQSGDVKAAIEQLEKEGLVYTGDIKPEGRKKATFHIRLNPQFSISNLVQPPQAY